MAELTREQQLAAQVLATRSKPANAASPAPAAPKPKAKKKKRKMKEGELDG